MTKQELEERLNQALEAYKTDTLALSDPYGKRPVTDGELHEFARQTFYALHEFKTAILEYLP